MDESDDRRRQMGEAEKDSRKRTRSIRALCERADCSDYEDGDHSLFLNNVATKDLDTMPVYDHRAGELPAQSQVTSAVGLATVPSGDKIGAAAQKRPTCC
eukprot:6122449-Amphidinium_carterae.2